ncbi:MAG: acyl-ACP--UDP-N-acetylglucosamine O-acyltransferase [Phycisphaerae bacterium]|nr:acyl-ACP--UDP-N-acetylglucosamine O-acyltransferase [Phycisphaerae bacterium]
MIHPSAYVDKTAELGQGVKIGPHCFVGPHSVLGDDCELRNNVTIGAHTTIGRQNVFFAGTVVGEDPQDLKFKGQITRLIVGDDNVFRECVTVNRGTEVAGGITQIGSHNRFMAYVHIAHDVVVGNGCILSNAVQLAGHVHLEDCVTMGGIIGIHHFTTIGRLAYVGGMTRIVADVPPFMIVEGNPSRIRGFNERGMERWGSAAEQIAAVRDAYRMLFGKKSDQYGSLLERVAIVEQGVLTDDVRYLCNSIRNSLDHGVYGRHLERLRRDTNADRQAFYSKKA